MKTLKTRKWLTSSVCLTAVILLLAAHRAAAQIRIGPVTVNIPEISKPTREEKPATTVAPPREASATNSGESTAGSSAPARPSTPQSDARLEILLEEINKRKKEIETYDPAERTELITMSTPEMFLPAISMTARATYYKRDRLSERQQAALNPALDSLAALAAKKLPLYKPNASVFAFRSPAAELMMKQSVKNPATLKVHRSGIKESVWLIEKNELGIPLDRYKHGYIWARDSSDDHPYCHFYTIHVQQNYAGGGTYGAVFARLSDDVIVGCP
ncbi:MAG: hypothetical protein ND895_00480 [Pyrinomonadaceae bacterium]|nr:hypothetical protein [Pyrinomonadaceae bacterium]